MKFLIKRQRLGNVRAHRRLQRIQEGSAQHSDEHGELSATAVLNSTVSTEENQQNVAQIGTCSNALVARDGTEWIPVVPRTNSRGRCSQQNILRECPVATSYARRNVSRNSPASAWFDD